MPKLITPEGELDEAAVEQKFAEAMAAPEPNEPPAPAPARKETASNPSPDPASSPSSAAGDSKARTRAASSSTSERRKRGRGSAKTEASAEPAEGAYTAAVAELLDALSISTALVPLPEGDLSTRLCLQADLIGAHRQGLAVATDAAARHNALIRRGVEALTKGSAGWVLPAVLAVAPFAAQSISLWRTPVDKEMTDAAATFRTNVRAAMMKDVSEAEYAGAAA